MKEKIENSVFEKLSAGMDVIEKKFLLEKINTSSVDITEETISDEMKRRDLLRKLGYLPSFRSATQTPKKNLNCKNILVVDDDPIALRAIMNILKDDYKVSVAKSGAAALAFLGRETPDLILLDYEMPIMDGAQTLQLIRSEDATKNIPVFFLTGVTDAEWVKKALALKPEGYILKTTPGENIKQRIVDYFAASK